MRDGHAATAAADQGDFGAVGFDEDAGDEGAELCCGVGGGGAVDLFDGVIGAGVGMGEADGKELVGGVVVGLEEPDDTDPFGGVVAVAVHEDDGDGGVGLGLGGGGCCRRTSQKNSDECVRDAGDARCHSNCTCHADFSGRGGWAQGNMERFPRITSASGSVHRYPITTPLHCSLASLSLALERSCPAAVVEVANVGVALNYAIDAWSLDSAAKRQHVAGLGVDDEVLFVDCASTPPDWFGSFEVA